MARRSAITNDRDRFVVALRQLRFSTTQNYRAPTHRLLASLAEVLLQNFNFVAAGVDLMS